MPDLPSGAVTFLFTDIEGSTRLVKQLRERYADVLQEHQRLLRAAFSAHAGHEIDTQGDSFFVAFASARDALLAAVDGQRALLSHEWPDGVRIAVRMGLHTGQAVASGGRYTGLAVHRAARIGAVGHGGQILVSQATQTLLEDEEEELGVALRDLGELRVKDLDRPVRLYEAVGEGLSTQFPPLGGQQPPAPRRGPRRRSVGLALTTLVLGSVIALGAVLVLGGGDAPVAVPPNSVAVVDAETGRVLDAVAVGTRPGPVTSGAGSVWIGNLDDRTVTRIDLEGRSVLRHISLDGRTPTGLAFGFGFVWVAHGLRGQLSRIDPQFNQPSPPVAVGGTAFGSPNGSVASGLGSVWAVFGDSTFARVDPKTARVAESTRAGTLPAGVVTGSNAVWVTNSGNATTGRYSPLTFTDAPLRVFTVEKRPTGIAAGEGAIWVANSASASVTRIDPDSGAGETIPVDAGPTAIAVAPGAVWVVCTEAGTLARIDPETNEVDETVEVGSAPAGIVFADGLLWVTVQAP